MYDRAYDDADQMTAAGGVTYGYDNNGNQSSRGTDTFGYNVENRLTSTNLGGTAGSYVYNGDGLRTSRTIGATTTTFAWGSATGMPAILRDGAGNSYLYGLDLISVSDSQNKKFYYHTDGLGSTTAITSSTGAVVKTYQYDVFGAIRAQTGTQPNEFTFTGDQNDSSGLEYLRARFYDGATGRFLIRDPLAGDGAEPQSLNRYPYVLNDPFNLVDPLGLHCRPWHPRHCSVSDVVGAVSTGVQAADLVPWGAIPFVNIPATLISVPLDIGALGFSLYDIAVSDCSLKEKFGLGATSGINATFGVGGQLVSDLASPSIIGPPIISGLTSVVETTLYLSVREKIERCGGDADGHDEGKE